MVTTSNIETFLLWLADQKYTGPVTIHCLDGIPRNASFGPPSKVSFYAPVAPAPPSRETPKRKGLDKTATQDADSESESSP